MSEHAANAQLIRRSGHNVTNEMTGETLLMVHQEGGYAKFSLGATIRPGQVINDRAQRSRCLVGEVKRHTGQQLVSLYRFHLTGRITRYVRGAKDSFGRAVGEPAIVADEVPLVWGRDVFLVSEKVDVAQGDAIYVYEANETYHVGTPCRTTAELRTLPVTKQNANAMMQEVARE